MVMVRLGIRGGFARPHTPPAYRLLPDGPSSFPFCRISWGAVRHRSRYNRP